MSITTVMTMAAAAQQLIANKQKEYVINFKGEADE
jgi:hypothetical protein